MSRQRPADVIHDIGYRHYSGAVESDRRTAVHLFVTGLRHAYGLGRSGRSKVLPWLLAALTLAPALVMVAMTGVLGLDEPPVGYADYTNQVLVPVSLFAAAQAPVLFSRDLRSRSIVLYLARPLSSTAFALVRWASLTVAVLLVVVVPTTTLWAGSVLAGADAGHETRQWATSLPLALLLSAALAGLTGVVSSYALRRGFAVVVSILGLVVLNVVAMVVQEVALQAGRDDVAPWISLVSPWMLVNGLADVAGAGIHVTAPPDGVAQVALYLAVALVATLASLVVLVARFRKAGR